MTRRGTVFALGALCVALGGCRRAVSDATSEGSSDGNAGELDDSDPEVCMEAAGGNLHYQCGEECVWLHADPNHCGACFNECRNSFTETACQSGECAVFLGECIHPDTGFSTCAQYCPTKGGVCEDHEGNAYIRYVGGPQACEGVERIISGPFAQLCEDPIDWGQHVAGYPGENVTGVQCLCRFEDRP